MHMIDLWKYEYCGKVKIVDIDENIFIGEALEVTDKDEHSEEENQELGITVEVNGTLIEFLQSDIKAIESI